MQVFHDCHGRVGPVLRWQHWACPLGSLRKRQWWSAHPTTSFYTGENRQLERGKACQQQNLYSDFSKWSARFLVVCPKQRLQWCSKQASEASALFPLSVLTGFLYLVLGLLHGLGITGIHCVFEPQQVRHCIRSTFWKSSCKGHRLLLIVQIWRVRQKKEAMPKPTQIWRSRI